MPSISLVDIREKVNRAYRNIEDLDKFLPGRELAEIPDNLITIEPQSDGHTHDVFIEPLGILSLPLRFAVCDVIHGLRSALDHLAYQLAIRNNFPLRRADRTDMQEKWFRRLCFLIHDSEQRFKSRAGEVEKVIGKPPVAQMERLQKYKALDQRADVLWTLSELDNITKHRVIVAVDPRFMHAHVTIGTRTDSIKGVVTITNPSQSWLKDRTQLFRFRVDSQSTNQPPKVNVNVKPVIEPVFADTDGLCDGANIFNVMRESVSAVASVVDDFERSCF
jgi:hypothetical protein